MYDYEDIRELLNKAEENRTKIAMFHYIALKHAGDFIDKDPKAFCKAVGMQESYATEFLKMRALYLLIKENRFSLNVE